MSPSVLLFTDRPGFEPMWRPACEQLDMGVRTLSPDALPSAAQRGVATVIDASSAVYDEDELLAQVGLAAALGAVVVVHLPSRHGMSAIEDVLDEMSPGLVLRGDDVSRAVALVARRLDPERAMRFEFLTVSPRGGELLAILGDGRAVLLERPVSEADDRGEVESIALADDARSATVGLVSGGQVTLLAAQVARHTTGAPANGAGNGIPIDGERLGARLRELRLEAGLTQAELARRTGIHRPNIARVEAGRHTPSLETLARLATAIGVPTTRVLSED